jgi:hypothetical protein
VVRRRGADRAGGTRDRHHGDEKKSEQQSRSAPTGAGLVDIGRV